MLNTGPVQFARPNICVLLLLTLSAFVSVVGVILIFNPEPIIEHAHKFSRRDYEGLLANRFEFLLDLFVLWLIAVVLTILDLRCRRIRGQALLRYLFVGRRRVASSPGPVLSAVAAFLSFAVAPALIVIFLGRFVLNVNWLFKEDGPLEYASFFGFACAAMLMGVCAWRSFQKRKALPRWHVWVLAALSAALFFVSMEEISWGQRILNLETPESLVQINRQNELNVHNIFNEYLNTAYRLIAGAIFALGTLSCWWQIHDLRANNDPEWRYLLPDGSMIFLLGLIFMTSIHISWHEIVECLAAFVVLLYAVNLYAAGDNFGYWRNRARAKEHHERTSDLRRAG